MNNVYLIGNLTRDPELRATQSGIAVCNFSLAVNRRFINQQTGQRDVDFFNIVAWRQLAELCSRYLAKGRKVAVRGSIQTRTYQHQDGSTRQAFDIIADEIEFLSPANGQPEAAAAQHVTAAANNNAAAATVPAPNYDTVVADTGFTQVDEDELPF